MPLFRFVTTHAAYPAHQPASLRTDVTGVSVASTGTPCHRRHGPSVAPTAHRPPLDPTRPAPRAATHDRRDPLIILRFSKPANEVRESLNLNERPVSTASSFSKPVKEFNPELCVICIESILLLSLTLLKFSNHILFLSAFRFTNLSTILNFPISSIESDSIEVLNRFTLKTFII